MAPECEYLTSAQAARVCNVSTFTLAAWRRKKAGPPCFKIGGAWRYEKLALHKWIDEQKGDVWPR